MFSRAPKLGEKKTRKMCLLRGIRLFQALAGTTLKLGKEREKKGNVCFFGWKMEMCTSGGILLKYYTKKEYVLRSTNKIEGRKRR